MENGDNGAGEGAPEPETPGQPPTPDPAIEPEAEVQATEEQSRIAANFATAILLLVTGGLAIYVLSFLAGRLGNGEWDFLAWIAEMQLAWKLSLALFFSLISLLFVIFSEVHNSGVRLRQASWLLGIAMLLVIVLAFATTRIEGAALLGPNFETFECSLTNPEFVGDRNRTEAREQQINCHAGLLRGLWISLLLWLTTTLATVLGIRSRLMNRMRRRAGRPEVVQAGGNDAG